ncbi:MAG: hypothetical protein R3B53_03790 [Candidatus Paceibacterota bacterium]
MRLPIISIDSDPEIIRSGTTATLNINIDADYQMVCTLSGGVPLGTRIDHIPPPSINSYMQVTNNLTSGQVVTIQCEHSVYGFPVVGSDETRVDVIPSVQEILVLTNQFIKRKTTLLSVVFRLEFIGITVF